VALIRRQDGGWHEPATTAFSREQDLQELLRLSPSLVTSGERLAVVDEFWIPGVGSVDLVGVGANGDLTLVECKLKANPEIWREVVGQILAYAGGLWHMPYDDLAQTFSARARVLLPKAVETAAGEPVNEADLRAAITRRLAEGAFRLVIAVDAITPELRLIVEYLNGHTLSTVQVLALELDYAREGDVELLIPKVYGSEAADAKERRKAATWNAAKFRRAGAGANGGPGPGVHREAARAWVSEGPPSLLRLGRNPGHVLLLSPRRKPRLGLGALSQRRVA
jgi:hypothetical protein